MVATTVTTIVQCTPVNSLWDRSVVTGTCINTRGYWYANSGITLATNIIILALPFQPIHASGLPGGQKIALVIVFALGMLYVDRMYLLLEMSDTNHL